MSVFWTKIEFLNVLKRRSWSQGAIIFAAGSVDEEFHPAKSGTCVDTAQKESRTQVHIVRLEQLRNHSFKAENYNLTQNK